MTRPRPYYSINDYVSVQSALLLEWMAMATCCWEIIRWGVKRHCYSPFHGELRARPRRKGMDGGDGE
jgi:hypothetical protein